MIPNTKCLQCQLIKYCCLIKCWPYVHPAGSKGDTDASVPQDPATTAVVEQKDANSTSPVNIHKDPHEVGDKNTIEASDKKAAVSPPVEKPKSDTMNKQSSAKCDDSKSDAPSDKSDAKFIKPDDSTVDLEMEVDSISDSDSDPEVNDLVIDLNKKRCQDDKQLTISVDKAANEAFVIDLDKDDDQKHDIKSSDSFGASPKGQKVGERVVTATSRSELQSSKKPVKYKSERQKEIERQQRHVNTFVISIRIDRVPDKGASTIFIHIRLFYKTVLNSLLWIRFWIQIA